MKAGQFPSLDCASEESFVDCGLVSYYFECLEPTQFLLHG